MSTGKRPLSPHLQVYRLPMPALMSITHRITGVGLAIGLLLVAYWLAAAAYGPAAFARAQAFVGSWFGQLLLFGWTVALYYHLVNGVRHLHWDRVKGLELTDLKRTGPMTIAIAGGLAVLTWIVALAK